MRLLGDQSEGYRDASPPSWGNTLRDALMQKVLDISRRLCPQMFAH